MEIPTLAQVLFIISIIVFLMALILIIPTVMEERRLQRRTAKSKKNWHLPFHRLKRSVKNFFSLLFSLGIQKAFLSSTGLL